MRLASTELQTQDPWIIEEKYPFDFDVLFRVHYQHKTAQGLENLVKLMQESKAQECDSLGL